MREKQKPGTLALWVFPVLMGALSVGNLSISMHPHARNSPPRLRYLSCSIKLPGYSCTQMEEEIGRTLSAEVAATAGVEEIGAVWMHSEGFFLGRIGTDSGTVEEMVRRLLAQHPAGTFSIREYGGVRGFPALYLVISTGSEEGTEITESAYKTYAGALARAIPGIGTSTLYGLSREEIHLVPRDRHFPPAGVDPEMLGRQIASLSGGESFAGYLENRNIRIPAMIRSPLASLDVLRKLPLLGSDGRWTLLEELVQVELRSRKESMIPDGTVILELNSGIEDLGLFFHQVKRAVENLPAPGDITLLPGPVSQEYGKRIVRILLMLLCQLPWYFFFLPRRAGGLAVKVLHSFLSLGSNLMMFLLPELMQGVISLDYLYGAMGMLWLVPVLSGTGSHGPGQQYMLPLLITLPLHIPLLYSSDSPIILLPRLIMSALLAATLSSHFDRMERWPGILFRGLNMALLVLCLLPPGRYLDLLFAPEPRFFYFPPEHGENSRDPAYGASTLAGISLEKTDQGDTPLILPADTYRILFQYPWIIPPGGWTLIVPEGRRGTVEDPVQIPFPREKMRFRTLITLPEPESDRLQRERRMVETMLPFLGARRELGSVRLGTGPLSRNLPVVLDFSTYTYHDLLSIPGISLQQKEEPWYIHY